MPAPSLLTPGDSVIEHVHMEKSGYYLYQTVLYSTIQTVSCFDLPGFQYSRLCIGSSSISLGLYFNINLDISVIVQIDVHMCSLFHVSSPSFKSNYQKSEVK